MFMIRRIARFIYRCGTWATVRKMALMCYVPTKITGLYFRRLGGVGARGVARIIRRISCERVDTIFTHGFGVGSDMYLDNQIAILARPQWSNALRVYPKYAMGQWYGCVMRS